MKVNENTELKLDLKTIISIIVITASFVGMYFTLQSDIEVAKQMPPSEINRIEYDLKQESINDEILDINERIDDVEEVLETMFKLGVELDKELHKIDKDYDNEMDIKIKEVERKIMSNNSKKKKRR
tara:strand:- start:264 stop:641 length:378 start_codon:yes stop_codon:yes gene_type:complete